MRNTIPMFLHQSSHMRRRWEMPAGICKALFFVFEWIRVSIVLYFVVQCSELERQQQPSISALKLRVSKFYRRIEHRYIFQLWWISKDGLFAWFLGLFHFPFLSLLFSITPWKTFLATIWWKIKSRTFYARLYWFELTVRASFVTSERRGNTSRS